MSAAPPLAAPPLPRPAAGSRRRWVLAGAGAGVLLLAVVAGFLLFRGGTVKAVYRTGCVTYRLPESLGERMEPEQSGHDLLLVVLRWEHPGSARSSGRSYAVTYNAIASPDDPVLLDGQGKACKYRCRMWSQKTDLATVCWEVPQDQTSFVLRHRERDYPIESDPQRADMLFADAEGIGMEGSSGSRVDIPRAAPTGSIGVVPKRVPVATPPPARRAIAPEMAGVLRLLGTASEVGAENARGSWSSPPIVIMGREDAGTKDWAATEKALGDASVAANVALDNTDLATGLTRVAAALQPQADIRAITLAVSSPMENAEVARRAGVAQTTEVGRYVEPAKMRDHFARQARGEQVPDGMTGTSVKWYRYGWVLLGTLDDDTKVQLVRVDLAAYRQARP
jgi:hypothetical protein